MNEFGKGIVSFGLQQAANTIAGNTAQKRQERLMGISLRNQKELNRQGRDIPVSYTHLRAHRDRQKSRMPSSA